jgi:hypothetical protein
MAKAARDLLAVPGSEVDVERLFCGRDLLGIRRYGLHPETMRMLTLLKDFFERQLSQGVVQLPEASTSRFLNRKYTGSPSCPRDIEKYAKKRW